MKVLFVGDICGRPGRQAAQTLIPELRRELDLDFVIANGENAAGGVGLTPDILQEFLQQGVGYWQQQSRAGNKSSCQQYCLPQQQQTANNTNKSNCC